jgi:dipeptidyl-peptidase-4
MQAVLKRALPVILCAMAGAAPVTAQAPTTAPERTNWEQFTTHAEMMDYLVALRGQSRDMRLSSYGETREGRELPYVIFSRPLVSQPWEAALLGKPIVLLAANVHGGERTLRESLLLLLRSISTPGTPENALLDHMTIIAAPQINPDGFSATERGQRGNAWGIDLNRDYMKLEHPEIANYVGELVNGWHPHLFIDGHNGGAQPYNIAHQCPSNAASDQRITDLCDNEIFPAINRALGAEGMKAWYYHTGQITATRWPTGGFQARIGRNYGGLVNSVGILFESPGGQNMERGVRSGYIAYRTVLEYVQQNAQKLVATVNRARMETLAMGLNAEGEVPVTMRYGPANRRVQYEIPQGQGADRRFVQVTSDSLMIRPIATQTRPRPYAYILPRDAEAAVAMLRRHGITVEQLRDSVRLEVQAYPIADVQYSTQYNHQAAVQLRVGDPVTQTRLFPRGTYVVPTGQMLGRVVSHLLEPETDDNVIYWNTMDAWLPRPRAAAATPPAVVDPDDEPQPRPQQGPVLVPIYKLMTPRALPSSIIVE